MKRALYFGCRGADEPGHYLQEGKETLWEVPEEVAFWSGRMDGTLLRNGQHPDVVDGKVWWTAGGGPLWYAFFWWDRSGDSRLGFNSGFYVGGFAPAVLTLPGVQAGASAAFRHALESYPWVVARQRHFPVLQLLSVLQLMDWKAPDYGAIFQGRMDNLDNIRSAPPSALRELKDFYGQNPAEFINDWGVVHEPRNVEVGLPALLPLILFDRQREMIDYVLRKWRAREPGLIEKSRDVGASWVAMALSCTLCLFHEGVSIGVGSRKAIYVDKIGERRPLLPKARTFMEHLPEEFRGGWVAWRDAPSMRINFPDTGSIISGEGGDEIGRGDRTSLYFVDEAAHLERAELVEASLSQTPNCRIDMSSVRGMANPFAQKRWGGKVEVFIFDWREDPRKDEEWYEKQCNELDPVVVAQEIDRDYSASVKGIVIPGAWVRSAIGAREKLGIAPAGRRGLAFDVADEGDDKDAIVEAEGIEITHSEEWTGKGSDVFFSTEIVFEICDEQGYDEFRYDADGIGAGVRGDARVINERRRANGARPIAAVGYRGSEGVFDPEGVVEGTIGLEGDKGRTNQDYFGNRKAQSWWAMRKRFQRTHRWVVEGVRCNPDDIVSLSPKNPNLMKLVAELSQATYRTNEAGKIIVMKKGQSETRAAHATSVKSPNMADAAVIHYAPMERAPVPITGEILAQIARSGRRRVY